MERNEHRLITYDETGDCVEVEVYSSITHRYYYGSTVAIAQANRSEAERIHNKHHGENN